MRAAKVERVEHSIVRPYGNVKFGADPEAFFENDKGLIVGSELVIPKDLKDKFAQVVKDGVQLEIHVKPSFCRQEFAGNIANAFFLVKEHLAGKNPERVKMTFKSVIRMTQGEMNKLSDKSRVLGCAPSENIYNAAAEVGVNPATYKVRSAGGHVHLGFTNQHLKDEYQRIIRMCDIFVGNQCVLLDREPLMKLRRRVYGRAGECRQQKYGVEYRTLSNFWLKSEPLTSFVLAMTRMATSIITTTDGLSAETWNAEKEIFDYINLKKIIKAINDNDFDLALENFEGISKFISKHFQVDADGLNSTNVEKFKAFAKVVNKKGLEFFFPEDPIDYWTDGNGGAGDGWETFIKKIGRKI